MWRRRANPRTMAGSSMCRISLIASARGIRRTGRWRGGWGRRARGLSGIRRCAAARPCGPEWHPPSRISLLAPRWRCRPSNRARSARSCRDGRSPSLAVCWRWLPIWTRLRCAYSASLTGVSRPSRVLPLSVLSDPAGGESGCDGSGAALVACGGMAGFAVGGMRRDASIARCAHRWRVRCDAAISVFRRSPVLSVAAYTRFAARRSEILQQGGLHLAVGDALLHRGHGDRRGGLLAGARRTRPPWSGAALMGFTRRQYLYLFGAGLSAAPANTLSERWRQIAAETDGTVGAAALHLGSGQHVSMHGA